MRMGAYSSVESLSQSYWNISQPDPWRSFDLYADYVMERTEQPFSLAVVKLLARLVTEATPQVLHRCSRTMKCFKFCQQFNEFQL